MKSPKEFDQYHEKELKYLIEALEHKRQAIKSRFSFKRYRRSLLILLVIDIAAGISSNFDWFPKPLIFIIPLSALYALFAPIYIFVRRNLSFDPINKEYKATVIPKIISFFGSTLKYKPAEGITQQEMEQSEMFSKPSGFKSEDLVDGVIDGIEVKLSDIQSIRSHSGERYARGKSASKSSRTSTAFVFQGMYFIGTTKQQFPARVILKATNVISNALNSLATSLMGEALIEKLQDNLSLNIIKTGNAEFDKLYTVKCSDESISRNLLSPSFMNLIMALRKEVPTPVDFSFFDNQVHIAFHSVNMFEGDAHVSFIEKDISRKYFNLMNYAVGIAEAVHV